MQSLEECVEKKRKSYRQQLEKATEDQYVYMYPRAVSMHDDIIKLKDIGFETAGALGPARSVHRILLVNAVLLRCSPTFATTFGWFMLAWPIYFLLIFVRHCYALVQKFDQNTCMNQSYSCLSSRYFIELFYRPDRRYRILSYDGLMSPETCD